MTNFKIICSMADGSHKILRGALDVVAHFNAAFHRAQANPNVRIFDDILRMEISRVASARIVNEYTGELLLAV